MQAIICDVCESQVGEVVFELQMFTGRPVRTEGGAIKIADLHSARVDLICVRCASWITGARDYLRRNLRERRTDRPEQQLAATPARFAGQSAG